METKIKWNEGDGYITATYEGSGSGSASISSDVNEGIDREQSIKVETTDKSKSASILVQQEGLREVFLPSDGDFVLADGGTFNVLKGDESSEGGKIVNRATLRNYGYTYSYGDFTYPVASDIVVSFYDPFGESIYKHTIKTGTTYIPDVLDSSFSYTPVEDDTYIYEIIFE
ncbi:MAG: hypothetical protein IJE78_00460 [Bacteroidaceae bacterium]|nr:hypothetical protein [Bacteroidaceae bacterium]MBQ2855585.1 hypothetical protein [Bacteroidaceae bacterium]